MDEAGEGRARRRGRIREGWIVRRPAPREAAPQPARRPAPREADPQTANPRVSREVGSLVPFMTSGPNDWEDPDQFRGTKPRLRSGRARD